MAAGVGHKKYLLYKQGQQIIPFLGDEKKNVAHL